MMAAATMKTMNADALIMAMICFDNHTGGLCEFPMTLAGCAVRNFPDLARVFADFDFVAKLNAPSHTCKSHSRAK